MEANELKSEVNRGKVWLMTFVISLQPCDKLSASLSAVDRELAKVKSCDDIL